MITVIDKDGTEMLIGDSNLPAISSNGPNDIMVAIYRSDVRVWTFGPLTSLRPRDCFRKLDVAESNDEVFVVVTPPRLHKNFRGPPSVYLTGLSLAKLSHLLPPLPALPSAAKVPVLSSHARLLLEYQ